MGDDLAVGFALELATACRERLAQLAEILDDPVVDQRQLSRRVGVGVGRGRGAVRRPAGMRDTRRARRRIARQLDDQVAELTGSAPADELAAVDRADPGAVIAAVFHPPQAVDQTIRHLFPADDTDDAAHAYAIFLFRWLPAREDRLPSLIVMRMP